MSPRSSVVLYMTVKTCAVPAPAATRHPVSVGPVSAPVPPSLRLKKDCAKRLASGDLSRGCSPPCAGLGLGHAGRG